MPTKVSTHKKRKSTTTKKRTVKSARSTAKKSTKTTKSRSKTKKASKRTSTRKYSRGSQSEVKKEMHKFKRGTAKSGKGGARVKSRQQAIAIGLSKARAKGEKVPKKSSR